LASIAAFFSGGFEPFQKRVAKSSACSSYCVLPFTSHFRAVNAVKPALKLKRLPIHERCRVKFQNRFIGSFGEQYAVNDREMEEKWFQKVLKISPTRVTVSPAAEPTVYKQTNRHY
jgi:hypothetical protein